MQVPYRKPGKYNEFKQDPLMTKEKFNELTRELEQLKTAKRPKAAAEVSRLAELGDFSENVEYQLAKGRLRGINNAILKLEIQLNQAQIISPSKQSDVVQLGSTVMIETGGQQKTYQILGSSETNPSKGIISHTSPIGAALLGHHAGERVTVKLANKEAIYTIINIH